MEKEIGLFDWVGDAAATHLAIWEAGVLQPDPEQISAFLGWPFVHPPRWAAGWRDLGAVPSFTVHLEQPAFTGPHDRPQAVVRFGEIILTTAALKTLYQVILHTPDTITTLPTFPKDQPGKIKGMAVNTQGMPHSWIFCKVLEGQPVVVFLRRAVVIAQTRPPTHPATERIGLFLQAQADYTAPTGSEFGYLLTGIPEGRDGDRV